MDTPVIKMHAFLYGLATRNLRWGANPVYWESKTGTKEDQRKKELCMYATILFRFYSTTETFLT